jgi:hypothetical protein
VTSPIPTLCTRVGHASRGENQFFGYAVGRDLAGRETQTGLIALAVGGRRLSPEERSVLDDIAVVMTVADPRIWPLKLTRVVSSYGGTLPAIAAANLCIEGALIGHWTSGSAAELLVSLRSAVGGNCDDVEAVRREALLALASGQRWMGFGVPFRAEDERVAALRRCLEAHDRVQLPFFRLLDTLSRVLLELRGLRPNIGVAVGAACLDLGFRPREVSLLSVALGQTDYLANAVEGAGQKPEVLRNLPSQMVHYVGPSPRESLRAKNVRAG